MLLKKSHVVSVVLLLLILVPATSFSEPRLQLVESSFFILGSLSLDYRLIHATETKQRLSLNSDMGAGFFVVDNFALALSVPAEWVFVPAKLGTIGVSLFGTYFFANESTIFPYLGLSATPSYDVAAHEFNLSSSFMTGVLVGLSESVALDIGVAPKVQFPLNPMQNWKLSIPIGFLGIRAFF